MVSIQEAIFLGVLQGITEWLPISSSGHLVIAQKFLGVQDSIVLDLMLHLGSLLVVVYMFRQEILDVITKPKHRNLGYMVLIGSVPTAILGFGLKPLIESSFNNLFVVGVGLLFTSILLYSTKLRKQNKKEVGVIDALIVGFFQGVAIFPGVSRSGSTIASSLIVGIKREQAIRFSFLLFIPAILGAFIVQADKIMITSDFSPIIAGTLASMIVSYYCINFLIDIVKKKMFRQFYIYCGLLGLLLVLI